MVKFIQKNHSPNRSDKSLIFYKYHNSQFISEEISITIDVITNSIVPIDCNIICTPRYPKIFKFENPAAFQKSFNNVTGSFEVVLTGRIIIEPKTNTSITLNLRLKSGVDDTYPPSSELERGRYRWNIEFFDNDSHKSISYKKLLEYHRLSQLFKTIEVNKVLNDLGLEEI